jgi:hypothetical protein
LKSAGGSLSPESSAYINNPRPICFKLLAQVTRKARFLALLNAGKSSEARIAMIAITTSSSIKVNPLRQPDAPSSFSGPVFSVSELNRDAPSHQRTCPV